MNTCRNCDKPITSGTYCSTTCEEMDKHPAPRDDMEKMTIQLPPWSEVVEAQHNMVNEAMADPMIRKMFGDEMCDAIQAIEDEHYNDYHKRQ